MSFIAFILLSNAYILIEIVVSNITLSAFIVLSCVFWQINTYIGLQNNSRKCTDIIYICSQQNKSEVLELLDIQVNIMQYCIEFTRLSNTPLNSKDAQVSKNVNF